MAFLLIASTCSLHAIHHQKLAGQSLDEHYNKSNLPPTNRYKLTRFDLILCFRNAMISSNEFMSLVSASWNLSWSEEKSGGLRNDEIIGIFAHLWHFLISTLYFISRQQITNPKYIISYPDVHHTHGLISTTIGLNMRINSQYFEDGILRIKCVASISPVLWSGNKETVIQQQGLQQFEIPLPSIDTREVLFLGESRWSFWRK